MVAAPRCFHHAPPLRSLPLRAASSGRRTESSDEARAELAPVGRSDLLNLDLDALMLRLLQEPVPGEPGPATNPDQ